MRARISDFELHDKCRSLLTSLLQDSTSLWINGQVIREFLVQVTHPWTLERPLSINEALVRLEYILPSVQVAQETTSVQTELRKLLRDYQVGGKSIHDANIVATMLAYEIDILYTLDQGFTRYSDQISVLDAEGVAHLSQS